MINKKIPAQFLYNGRYVDTDNFRAFVYNEKDQKLAESYKHYQELIASGVWYSSREAVPKVDIADEVKKHASKKQLRGDNVFTIPVS